MYMSIEWSLLTVLKYRISFLLNAVMKFKSGSVCCLLVCFSASNAMAESRLFPLSDERRDILVLYDNAGEFGHIGKEHAMMIENLLGHFHTVVKLWPVSEYQSGQIDGHDVIFYIGSTFNEPEKRLDNGEQKRYENYQSFLADVAVTDSTVVWLNHNLKSLVNQVGGVEKFIDKYGFQFLGIDNSRKFNRVEYKGVELHKGVVVHANPGASMEECMNETDGTQWVTGDNRQGPWACDTVLNTVKIVDADKSSVYATAYLASEVYSDLTRLPYVTRSVNFWYIGDLPFLFLSEEDRYLVFADVLHDILESGVIEEKKHILLRLEDVSPGKDHRDLKKVAEYLESENIPFTIAAVATYEDPRGMENSGVPRSLKMPGSSIAKVVKRYYDKGLASILMHGYSHQWSGGANPFNEITGHDFEFFRVTKNEDGSLNYLGALPEDSAEWATDRVTEATHIFYDSGFKPFAWEAAHYMASETDYVAIQQLFPIHYGRLIYFSDESPDGQFFSQFFPYLIEKDLYGYQLIPENMGNVTPAPISGYRAVSPEDLVRYAKKLSVVRDRVASFFYHPELGVEPLERVVDGVRQAGYEFVSPCELGYECDGRAVVVPERKKNVPSADKSSSGGGAMGLIELLLATMVAFVIGRRCQLRTYIK